jgi:predicted nucleotidyltransferase
MVKCLPKEIQVPRREILEIAGHHGASEVALFGSASRGDLHAESDYDFLVQAGSNTSAWFPAGRSQDLESLLGRHVDVVTAQALHPLLRDRILAEAVSL